MLVRARNAPNVPKDDASYSTGLLYIIYVVAILKIFVRIHYSSRYIERLIFDSNVRVSLFLFTLYDRSCKDEIYRIGILVNVRLKKFVFIIRSKTSNDRASIRIYTFHSSSQPRW